MKIKYIALSLFISSSIFAQVVTTIPQFPEEEDSIIVYFDASEGNKGLTGYTGTVYAHTGVITNISGTDWTYVIGNWGDNQVQPRLTRIDTDLYELIIGYPREFYDIRNSNEHILELAFVFRSSDGNRQTDDILVQLHDPGLSVSLVQPENMPLYPEVGDELYILAAASENASLSLYINEELVDQNFGNSISYSFQVNQKRRSTIKVVAENTSGERAADSSFYIARDPLTIEELPGGIQTGINYINDNTVTLALYAPNKDFVYAIGDFNDWEFAPEDNLTWEFDPNYYMKLSPDSSTYWITLNWLTPGMEYAFQYLVDGNLKIADPYTEKILDPDYDDEISFSTYTNLKPYPTGKTSEIVSIFQTSQAPFIWEAEDYQRPANTDLVIYELLMRDFLSTHKYSTLIDTLDYLQKLGINAVELMPITEFEGNSGWGYNPSFYFAPDKYYGPKDDLKKFIDEAHKRGIAVILDIVLNHSYGQSPLVRLYSSGNNGPPTEENPWYNVASPHKCFSWGYDFNHESPHTQAFVDRVTSFWLTEYNFDGFRFDFTKGFTNTPSDGNGDDCGWSMDNSRIAILKRMADRIWEVDSTAYVILEHLTANNEEKELADYGMMLWGNSNYNYNEATMGYNQNDNSNFSGMSYKIKSWNKPHLVGYMESHDEERLMYKNLQYGNSSGSYNIQELNTALNRIKLAAAFFFTIPGPKMIWQFGELGYDYSINYPSGTENDRLTPKPIKWDYLDIPDRKKLYKVFSALIDLKKNYDIFRTDDFELSVSGDLKKIKLNSDSTNVLIIGNFNTVNGTITPGFQSTGLWYDFFPGDSIYINDTQQQIALEPGEFSIYSTQKFPTPEENILTGINEMTDNAAPYAYNLEQNYPNPFNPFTSIKYRVSRREMATLKVFDILGREIKTLVNKVHIPGNYRITFNASGLPSGVYFYKLQAGSYYKVRKMLLIK